MRDKSGLGPAWQMPRALYAACMSDEHASSTAWNHQDLPHWPRERASTPLATSCLLAASLAAGAAILGWFVVYAGGSDAIWMSFFLLIVLASCGGVLTVAVLLLGAFKHPVARQAMPLLVALLLFIGLTGFGTEVVIPGIYEWRIGIAQTEAVAGIEGYRKREGLAPSARDAQALLPHGVDYRETSGAGYTLQIEDRFAFFAGGWTYSSSTHEWTHWVD